LADHDLWFWRDGLPRIPFLLEVLLVYFGEMVLSSLGCFQEDIRFSFPFFFLLEVELVLCHRAEDDCFPWLQ
jgi:hypothetical protein